MIWRTLPLRSPVLKTLELGSPCKFNLCDTTVASLLSISVHCLDLTALETHFNTEMIVSDIKRLLDGGAGRDKAKCKLRCLVVEFMRLKVGEEDIEAIAVGFNAIFPCLTEIDTHNDDWTPLERKLGDLQI